MAKAWPERIVLGCFWGLGSFALLTRWMLEVSLGGYILFALALTVAPMVFAGMMIKLERLSEWGQLIWWPCAWVVSEWLRSFLLGGFTWTLAYSQASNPTLIQAARWGGSWAVVWILVLVNAALCLAMSSRGARRNMFFILALVMFCINVIIGIVSPRGELSDASIKVALIQPNISHDSKNNITLYDANAQKHFDLTRKVVESSRADLIVWPETSFPDDVLTDVKWRGRVSSLARDLKAELLLGSALETGGHSRNAALHISSRGEWREVYSKNKLLPFTEYLPAGFLWEKLAGTTNIKPYDFIVGKGLGIFSIEKEGLSGRNKSHRFGVVICSEEADPGLVRQLARRQILFLVVMLNDGWFQNKEALLMHSQNAVFRAVEAGVPLVRVANTGRSMVIDCNGRVIKGSELHLQSEQGAVWGVPTCQKKTLYSLIGDFFVWLCLGFVIITNSYLLLKL